MAELRCDTCRYFDAAREECHINPPTMHPDSPTGIWPSVDRFDWCGEWEGRPHPSFDLPIVERSADDLGQCFTQG